MANETPLVLHTRVVTGTGGGPEKTILNSPRFLEPYGYRALCVYMHPPGDPGFEELRVKARQLDAPLVGIEDRGPWDVRVVRRLLEICRRERVSIWHGHDYKSNAIGLLLRRFWPMTLVSTVHGWGVLTGRTPFYNKIDRVCLRWYDRVIAVSDDLMQACLDAGTRPERCQVIENAIDTQEWSRRMTPQESKRRLGFDPNRLLVSAVGRLSDEKNFDGLIRAADRLWREGLDFDLIIVGEGDRRPALESLIRQLDRSDRVRLLGFRSDTVDLYQAMDVFVLGSLREGLPNVVLEAMAMEVPVVATRVAGVPRLVTDRQEGLVVPPGDETGLADALGQMLRQPELREQMRQAARRKIETHYSFERRMEKMRKVYDDILGRASDVPPR
jgi:glycosyltransferase involved in cell wall biosynthesis